MIGAQLRAFRLQFAGISLERAAELAQMSLATLSRTENGRKHIPLDVVAMLLALYRVPRDLRDELLETARSGFQQGVWQSVPRPGCPIDCDGITVLEAEAHRLTDWAPGVVPPLLQTPEYAAALFRAVGVDDVDSHVEHRIRRQEVLRTTDYTAFIHEPVLSVADVGQIAHLHAATERGVGVRVVPAEVLSAGHPWLLMEFPNDPPVVHIGLRKVGVYLHEPEADDYRRLRELLGRAALSTLETRLLLDQARSARPADAAREATVARVSSGRRSTSADSRARPEASRWVSTAKMSVASGSSAATAAASTAGTWVSGSMAKISAKRVSSSL